MLGPIDFIVIGFQGNAFDGSVMRELSAAIENKIIRVIDLLFIIKDAKGNVIEGEFEDQSEDLKEMLNILDYKLEQGTPLLSDDDIAKIGDQMPNNTAAGVLVLEHVWAKGLKQALIDAGGFLVADGRIHPEAVEAAMQELQVAAA